MLKLSLDDWLLLRLERAQLQSMAYELEVREAAQEKRAAGAAASREAQLKRAGKGCLRVSTRASRIEQQQTRAVRDKARLARSAALSLVLWDAL